MVDIDISSATFGSIVRFKRQTWSSLLGRHYLATDLIIVVSDAHRDDLLADFEIYRQMDDASQVQFIEHLRMSRYAGRLLSEKDSPHQPDDDGQPDQYSSQMSLI